MGRRSNIQKSEEEAEIYEPMDFDEITRRLRNGADIQTLADLHGWGYTKMVQRLQYMEKKHGRQLLTPDIMRPSHRKKYLAQKAAAARRAKEPEPNIKDIKPRWPKEIKTVPEDMPAPGKMVNVDITKYNCATCANVIARPESYSTNGHVEIEKYCTKGHGYGGTHACCSEYVTSALEPFIKAPQKKPIAPEEPEPERIPEEVYTARVIIPPPEGQKIITASVLETILAHAEESRRLANEYAADAEAWQTIYNLATKGTAFPEGKA